MRTNVLALSFFFNDPPTPQIYTLSLHDALPIFPSRRPRLSTAGTAIRRAETCRTCGRSGCLVDAVHLVFADQVLDRSEEHTSELQSHHDLVCRLLLEKKNIEPAEQRLIVPVVYL